jgi:hypothetical protein
MEWAPQRSRLEIRLVPEAVREHHSLTEGEGLALLHQYWE